MNLTVWTTIKTTAATRYLLLLLVLSTTTTTTKTNILVCGHWWITTTTTTTTVNGIPIHCHGSIPTSHQPPLPPAATVATTTNLNGQGVHLLRHPEQDLCVLIDHKEPRTAEGYALRSLNLATHWDDGNSPTF